MKLHVKMKYCTIEHVKVLDFLQTWERIGDWKYDTKSEYLIQDYSTNLLVALLFITVLSPRSSAEYRSVKDGAEILLMAL